MLIGPWAVQDALENDVVRSFFRLVVWVRFFDLLKLLLGSFWAASGSVLGLFGPSWQHLGALMGSFWPPWARFLVRECGLGVFFQICLSMFACRFSICGLSLSSFAFRFVDAARRPGTADCALRDQIRKTPNIVGSKLTGTSS